MPALLSTLVKRRDVDFAKWDILFADERCVPLDSDDSNFKACDDVFLSKLPGVRVHTMDPTLEPSAAAEAYEAEFVSCGGRLDLALLGSGADGHTASLFPSHPLFEEPTTKLVAPIYDSPKPPPRRITFTLPVLKAARNVAFVATGAAKADIFATMFYRRTDGSVQLLENPPHLPVTAVKSYDGTAEWFIDSTAAAKIAFNPSLG